MKNKKIVLGLVFVTTCSTLFGCQSSSKNKEKEKLTEFTKTVFTIPSQEWLDAEAQVQEEFEALVAEDLKSENPSIRGIDTDAYIKATQEMIGDYILADEVENWSIGTLWSIQEAAFNSGDDLQAVQQYSLVPDKVEVKSQGENSGNRWDFTVNGTLKPNDGEEEKVVLEGIIQMNDDGTVHSLELYDGGWEILHEMK